MSDETDNEFFQNRKESKTYLSKVFSFNARNLERVRQVRMVIDGSDRIHFGEIQGAMCLRLSGKTRRTQVTALVTQDDQNIKRITLQTFKSRSGDWVEGIEKDEFTFRDDEFDRLVRFLNEIAFIDMSNEDRFQIEDISTNDGPKAIINASDRSVIDRLKAMSSDNRNSVLQELQRSLTDDEINILLGRKQGLEEFAERMNLGDWDEGQWQDFFEREPWVFGYGLDYRVMRPFDREMTVGGGGADNQNRPVIDFLMSFTDYTVLVEIKRPDTRIFRKTRGGRAGTWEFSREFMNAFSQILEQKAEWLAFSHSGEHFNKSGTELLSARTKNAKTILVIGSTSEFSNSQNSRDGRVMRDTFELFRRENHNIDIITFDELLDRARFITRS